MTAPYGFKFAHTFDGSGTSAVKILPVSSPGTGGLVVGDPVTVASGFARLALGGESDYGVVCGLGKNTGAVQSIGIGGNLTNSLDPYVNSIGASDTGYVAVMPADNAVFRTVLGGVHDGGTIPASRLAAIGTSIDIANAVSGSPVELSAAAAHATNGVSKLCAAVDGSTPSGDLIIQGFAAIGGSLTTRSIPSPYNPTTATSVAGDELFVTFVNVQHNPV